MTRLAEPIAEIRRLHTEIERLGAARQEARESGAPLHARIALTKALHGDKKRLYRLLDRHLPALLDAAEAA